MPINPADISTIRVGELPVGSITLTSKLAVENGTDLQQIDGQALVDFVNTNASALQFEVKDLWVNQAYIDNNFDETGLGINLLVGYALCNGQNGTPPMDGLVSIGYGTNYNVVGAFGGSKDAVLVQHSHTYDKPTTVAINSGAGSERPNTQVTLAQSTSTVGVSGTNKNMQPYIVLIKIMKL
jgi:hypothetical protein